MTCHLSIPTAIDRKKLVRNFIRSVAAMNVSINGVDDITDENKETFLMCDISDDVLETAACIGNKKAHNFTQWVCTALYFCPGP